MNTLTTSSKKSRSSQDQPRPHTRPVPTPLRRPTAERPGDDQCPSTGNACECIRARAYEIFAARRANGVSGDATSDWLQAERELTPAQTGTDQREPSIDADIMEARRAERDAK